MQAVILRGSLGPAQVLPVSGSKADEQAEHPPGVEGRQVRAGLHVRFGDVVSLM